jgi:glycosyltransferase involved in cell wall biosynthesis
LHKPSLIICQKVTTTVVSTAIARHFHIPVILDTHDLYSLQINEQQEKININLDNLPPISSQHEKELLMLYDALISIQYLEADILKFHFPDKKIITALHPAETVFLPDTTDHIYTNSPELLFVASASPHNKDAINYFIESQLDSIIHFFPNIVLNICGDVGEDMHVNHKNISVLGRVKDLEHLYKRATLVINPVRYGSGLKIKTIDALAAGKCLVTTPNGAEGLPGADGVMVCIDAAEFGKKIVELLINKEKIRCYELAAHTYAKATLTTENCYAELNKLLEKLVPFYE